MSKCKLAAIALFFGASFVSLAGTIEIVPPADATVYGQASGYANSRGIYITADTAFSITSLGEFGYPIGSNTLLTASIFASDGTSRGVLLVSSSLTFASDGTTMTWNDIPLAFSFSAGQHYVLDFGFTAPLPENDLEAYYWYYPSGSTSSFDVAGLFTVTKGDDTVAGAPQTNPLIADFRVGTGAATVPEPTTVALLAGGLLGLVARAKLRRVKQ